MTIQSLPPINNSNRKGKDQSGGKGKKRKRRFVGAVRVCRREEKKGREKKNPSRMSSGAVPTKGGERETEGGKEKGEQCISIISIFTPGVQKGRSKEGGGGGEKKKGEKLLFPASLRGGNFSGEKRKEKKKKETRVLSPSFANSREKKEQKKGGEEERGGKPKGAALPSLYAWNRN